VRKSIFRFFEEFWTNSIRFAIRKKIAGKYRMLTRKNNFAIGSVNRTCKLQCLFWRICRVYDDYGQLRTRIAHCNANQTMLESAIRSAPARRRSWSTFRNLWVINSQINALCHGGSFIGVRKRTATKENNVVLVVTLSTHDDILSSTTHNRSFVSWVNFHYFYK